MRLISPPSNDDHPPSDVSLGQALVLKVYDALASSPKWAEDAAGDHLRRARRLLRPRAAAARSARRQPEGLSAATAFASRRSSSHRWSAGEASRTRCSTTPRSSRRSCCASPAREHHPRHGQTRQQRRSTSASSSPSRNQDPPETPELYRPLASKIDANRKDSTHQQLTLGANARAAADTQPTDLQHDYLTIQTAFMKQLIKEAPAKLTKFLP